MSVSVISVILIIVTIQHTHHPATRSAHVTPMLRSLHWLHTEQRIEYKLSPHCFKNHFASGSFLPFRTSSPLHSFPAAPLFCRQPCSEYRPSESRHQRSFSYQTPLIWNQLATSVRHSTSVTSFKSLLKTFACMRVRARACVRACVRACGCVGGCVCVWVRAGVRACGGGGVGVRCVPNP